MPVEWAAEDALAKISGCRIASPNLPRREYWLKHNRLARTVGKLTPRLAEQIFAGVSKNVVLFMMALRQELIPLLENGSFAKSVYLFDSWEPDWERIEQVFRDARNVKAVYMSSIQAAEHFQDRLPFPVKWLAQAANAEEFEPNASDWSRKRNIILNIGRSNPILDDFFEAFAQQYAFQYVKPHYQGHINFDERADMLKVLYQSKIVVVHPRNLVFPDVTGCVSTLTARYFEAYQSCGVVCGIKPDSNEFESVLRKMPFVDYRNPQQFESNILEALEQPAKWISAADHCKEFHTWEKRLTHLLA